MKLTQTITAFILISASSICLSDNIQNKRQSIDCQNAERAYRFVLDYRYNRPDDFQKKYNDVFKFCGYWPKLN